ncbi:MAG TPA: S9 family peptidase, partial [Thermomicrobiales bacterium]|nr:S9 family peptidase [Thermomicrobiales bacterium]
PQATRAALTPDRLIFDLQSTATPRISHDGARVAYIRSATERGTARSTSHLWLVDVDGANPRQLTQTGTSTSDPVWAPDNASIAFISQRGENGAHAICLLPLAGGEARVVTTHTQRPTGLAWSPDGTQIAYTIPVDPENPDETPRDPGAPPAVRVITRIDYKQDNRGYLNDVRHQVMVVDVASGDRRQVSTELWDHSAPQWSPDGTKLAAKISNRNGMHSELGVLPVDGGAAVRVGWQDGGIGTWAWSRDGSFVLFDGYPRSSPQTEYYRYDLATGETRQLTDDLQFSPESGRPTISGPAQPAWLDDRTALVHGVQHGASGLWTIDAETGDLTEVVRWQATRAGLSVDASGKRVVLGSSDCTTTGQTVLFDRETGETTVLVDPNTSLFEDTPAATVEPFSIDRDGWTIDAWLYKPADFDETKQYPLVLDVHGGPHGNYGYAFNIGAQILASHGILVVASNPRGSGTYGRAFGEAVRGDWGGEDWKDLQAVLAEVESRPYVDPARTGIYGYSYGGYMTSWAIGQTDRFKAAVCGAPVFNMLSFYGTSDIGHVFGESQWGGTPQEVGDWMVERSPSTHIHKAVTPTLIVHGEADDRCPIGQGEEMFVGLLKAGVEVEFVRYPGGSHMMLRGGPVQHRVDYYTRVLIWFQRHLT